ncbi:MAG: Twin-arginine translocation pathway signal [Rubrobacteraceae bacterium]|nr:Twin-arginine translocation pathway signal [Rubrobacteraceae bacterium]
MKGSAERRLLSRRRFLELGGAGLAGAALLGVAGCARQESKGLVRLVFSHGEDSEVLRDQIQRFNQRNKGAIEVALRLAPADTDQYFEKLRIEFQAGEAEADIISGDVIWPAQFAAKGWISDLSDLFTADLRASYLPATVDSNTYEGRIYGVPWFTDAGLLYYRQDLLEQAGFSDTPKTWDEMKEMVAKVRRDRGTRYGFVFQGSEYEGGVVNGLEFIWNSGGGVLAPHGIDKVIVAAPEAVAGLKTARGMVTGRVAPVAVPSYKEYESYTVFLNGDAVFMRNWPNVYARAADPSLSKVEQERIGVAPLPVAHPESSAHSGLGGWNLMVNTASEKTEAAWAFIRYLSAPEQQKERALKGGYLPTRKDCYEDGEILSRVPVIELGREAIRDVRSRPVTPLYHDMSLAMAEQFHASLAGMVAPERAAATLQERLQEILERSDSL